jgi:hypothetical protein
MIAKRGEENEGMILEGEPKLSVVPDRVRGRISQPPHASRIQSPTTPFLREPPPIDSFRHYAH